MGVPICPRCSATIHTGADDQCPACGYSLMRADEIFQNRRVEFTRVVDEAGALTHSARMELMHTLENLERKLPPVALCIYITDDGRVQHLRTHAHWVLNHARIHHPSFGKRELHKAIEDAEIRELRPGEQRPQDEAQPGFFKNLFTNIGNVLRDIFHPYAEPTRQEWMLILVLDVQLEMACFTWGYMLDPYVNPDSINSCIIKARLQFREREMVTALKRVMKSAVHLIASDAYAVNRRLRQADIMRRRPSAPGSSGGGVAALLATLAALPLLGAAPLHAQDAPPAAPAPQQEAPAQPPAQTPQQAAPTPPPPAPKRADGVPYWHDAHYRLLMSGELETGYTDLFPAKPEGKEEESAPKQKKKPERRPARSRNRGPETDPKEESDTYVPQRYLAQYTRSTPHGLCDPQNLLSTAQRDDIIHVLREMNVNAPFKLYVALFKAGQEIPADMTPTSLACGAAQPCEYAAMLIYPLGEPGRIDLGYAEIKTEDAFRSNLLEKVRIAAATAGDNTEGIMAALRTMKAAILPISKDFQPITAETVSHAPLIPIEYRPTEQKPEESMRDKLTNAMKDPQNLPYLFIFIGLLFVTAIIILYFIFWHHKSCNLQKTQPDLRLSSPYGASVSRYVRYLEGQEAGKEKRLF